MKQFHTKSITRNPIFMAKLLYQIYAKDNLSYKFATKAKHYYEQT